MSICDSLNRRIAIIIIVLLSLILALFMNYDVFFSGDEIVTYSMSNNDKAGFVFSEARISKYMHEYVFTGNVGDNISNLISTVVDVLKNKSNSAIFTSERDPEVILFSRKEMVDWFAKRPDERFNFGNTYIHSLGDDGQSWMYYSLINAASSIFLPISDTKWVGFLVNYLFFALTLFGLWKLGKLLSGSERDNFIVLACFCLWTETTHTVTNIRSYGVASFWATMLVLTAVQIFRSIVEDGSAKKSDFVKFVVIYTFGYVSHYTIGAILASLGLILVVIMLIMKKPVGSVIATGVIALIIGIICSPDSVIGLLSKFSGKGEAEATGGVFPVLIAAVVIFVGLIAYAVKKRETLADPFYYCFVSMLLEFIIIVFGTGRVGYSRVAYPIYFLLVFCVLLRIGDKFIGADRIKYVYMAFICVFGVINIILTFNQKNMENAEIIPKREALEAAVKSGEISTCIYFRERSKGYKDAMLLRDYFEQAQVITVDTTNWQELAEYDGSDSKIICYFTDESESEDALDWVKSLGYSSMNQIYSDEETKAYIALK